jgi:DNA-binding response OmpR family regulator
MDKKNILIVEDEESMLDVISDYLETQEFAILTARD